MTYGSVFRGRTVETAVVTKQEIVMAVKKRNIKPLKPVCVHAVHYHRLYGNNFPQKQKSWNRICLSSLMTVDLFITSPINLRKEKGQHSSGPVSTPTLWEHSSPLMKIYKASNTNTQITS